ncbi:amidohydrolase, partial [Streptomyces sp. NPDC059564]
MDNPARTTISNVRIFDGHHLTDPTSVALEDGLIREPSATPGEALDAQGATLLPGLIVTHVHVQSVIVLDTY